MLEHCKKIQRLEVTVIKDEAPANQNQPIAQQNNNNNNNNQAQINNNNDNNNAVQEENNNNVVHNVNNQADPHPGAQVNNPAPVVNTLLDFSVILERCPELQYLHILAPMDHTSFK